MAADNNSAPSDRSPHGNASEKQMMQWMQKSVNAINTEIKSIKETNTKIDKDLALSSQKLDTLIAVANEQKAHNTGEFNKLSSDFKESFKELKSVIKEIQDDHKKTHEELNGLKISLAKWAGGLAAIMVLVTIGMTLWRLFGNPA